MADKLDSSLDEILGHSDDKPRRNDSNRRDQNRPRERRVNHDGIRKSYRDNSRRDEPRNLDREWVHDRYDEDPNQRRRAAPRHDTFKTDNRSGDRRKGATIEVKNIHWELTQQDLEGLFNTIGDAEVDLKYDNNTHRSSGIAYVTYASPNHASDAIAQFNRANANGQPIYLRLMSGQPSKRDGRNPFDRVQRSLADRITLPSDQDRDQSPSPDRETLEEEAARKNIDRYIPSKRARSRSPIRNRRNNNQRSGQRRDNNGRDHNNNGRNRNNNNNNNRGNRASARPIRKTADELDAEMDNYFNVNDRDTTGDQEPATETVTEGNAAAVDDIDMIE